MPGSKTVYEKFKAYVPRKEPASGHAGGKVVKVDRVEFIWLSDPQTAQAALMAGEIDYLENPPTDFLPILESDPDIKVEVHPAAGTMGILRLNHLHPPFNNVKARQAMLYLINQGDFLQTIAADKKLQTLCCSYFGCGTRWRRTPAARPQGRQGRQEGQGAVQGGRLQRRADHDAARDRRPVHQPAKLVMVQQLREAGVLKVDCRRWTGARSSPAAPRRSRRPRAAGTFSSPGTAVLAVNEPGHAHLDRQACDKAWFGWPCDAKFEELRKAWATAPDIEKRKEIAVELLEARLRIVPYISFAQWRRRSPTGRTRSSGVISVPAVPPMWNIEKK